MGTITPEELLKLWKLEKMPVEMAIGHILQNLVNMRTTIESTDTTLYKLRADVDGLIAHTGTRPRSTSRQKLQRG